MALVQNTKYGGMIHFSEDTSTPSGSVALYAKSAGSGDNEHLVVHAPTASFTADAHISGTLRAEGTYTHLLNQHVTLGDSSLGYSRVTLPSNSQINGSLVTYVNGQGGVGTSSARWGSMYSINLDASGDVTLGDSSDDTVAISGTLGVEADATFNSQNVTLGDSSIAWSLVTLPSNSQINGSLVTYVNGIGGVGTSSARWGSMYSINLDASGDVTLGNTTADSITINGTVSDFTAGVITATELVATSDARLKSNIQDVTNAMDVINSLQGVEYDLIETGEHSMGVLAQELIEVAPALVKTRENGNYAVNYSGLSAFFVEAIKEQQVQIKDQKEQIEELKNLVKELASK